MFVYFLLYLYMGKKKALGIIGSVSGIIALLMLFVIPFIGIYFFSDLFNNEKFVIFYFIVFFILTATGNITLEKSNEPLDPQEERDRKINRLIKGKL